MSEDLKKRNIIHCPKCDWEYLPGEIYLANHLVGRPTDVERSYDGKILMYDGVAQDLEESFVCEHCGKPFKVKANISFETTYDAEHDFSLSFSAPLYKEERIQLNEQ